MVTEALAALGHDVALVGYARPADVIAADLGIAVIDRRPIEFSDAEWRQKLAWAGESLLRREPLSVTKYRRPQIMAALNQAMAAGVDCFLVDKPQIAALFADIIADTPVSVVWHAIEHQTYGAVAQGAAGASQRIYRREARLAAVMERATLARTSHVFVLAEADARALRGLGYDGPIDVLPMTVPDVPSTVPAEGDFAFDIGLLGNWTWSANASGLEWFLREVRPLLPGALSVAIGGAGSEAVEPTVADVKRCGRVDDASRFLGGCRAVAIPVNAGTGVSMKVLEAAAAGWPTVTTAIGARALDNLPDNVAVTTTAAEFAARLAAFVRCEPDRRTTWAELGSGWMETRRAAFKAGLASGIAHLGPGDAGVRSVGKAAPARPSISPSSGGCAVPTVPS
jgi:glycosyltransferase involved in cell wall biosynthesis